MHVVDVPFFHDWVDFLAVISLEIENQSVADLVFQEARVFGALPALLLFDEEAPVVFGRIVRRQVAGDDQELGEEGQFRLSNANKNLN